MGLFGEPITATLTDGELKTFHGITVKSDEGGPQRLYWKLEANLERNGGRTLVLEDHEALKVQRYAYDYGTGGYQEAFRVVVRALMRAGWEPKGTDGHDSRPEHKGRAWDGGNA